jgi:hypothetical protein
MGDEQTVVADDADAVRKRMPGLRDPVDDDMGAVTSGHGGHHPGACGPGLTQGAGFGETRTLETSIVLGDYTCTTNESTCAMKRDIIWQKQDGLAWQAGESAGHRADAA